MRFLGALLSSSSFLFVSFLFLFLVPLFLSRVVVVLSLFLPVEWVDTAWPPKVMAAATAATTSAVITMAMMTYARLFEPAVLGATVAEMACVGIGGVRGCW